MQEAQTQIFKLFWLNALQNFFFFFLESSAFYIIHFVHKSMPNLHA